MTDRLYIVAARRTPQGRFLGALAEQSAVDLAVAAGAAALDDARPDRVDMVTMGNVLAAGQGMNIARQVGVKLELPLSVPAQTVNMMCASGMQAAVLGAHAILAGDAEVVLCGGTESMTRSPYLLERARTGYKMGDGKLVDSMLRDGLRDAFAGEHMGLSAERLAGKYGLEREAQDRYALQSHRRYAEAWEAGRYAGELVEVEELARDEGVRPDTSMEKLRGLRTVFAEDGTVTAGNASGINDGAAVMVLCGEAALKRNGWRPLAALTGWASVGCDPSLMGLGPVHAIRALCRRYKDTLEDFDTIEINEAFAAQVLACTKELALGEERLNLDGGAIAMGHPIGTSGARLMVHLAQRIRRGETERGLAALCVGGGMGIAARLEACT